MAIFESGVKSFIKSYAVVEVNFPVDFAGKKDISCKYCQFFSVHSRLCQLNKEVVAYPEKFVGEHCPLQIIESENENG